MQSFPHRLEMLPLSYITCLSQIVMDFSSVSTEARRQWNILWKVLVRKKINSEFCYLLKISFTDKAEINVFRQNETGIIYLLSVDMH